MIDSGIAKVLILSLPLGLLHCSHDDKPARSADTTFETGPEEGMSPSSGTSEPNRQSEATEVGSAPMEALTDAQIVNITRAVNSAEVDQAKIAVGKAKDEGVKRFAQMMIAHHNEALKETNELSDKLGMIPADSKLLTELTVEATATSNKLERTNDASFDELYVLGQIDAHRKVLDTLDTRLIPHARNAELAQLLRKIRPRVAAHLEEAREILGEMKKGEPGK